MKDTFKLEGHYRHETTIEVQIWAGDKYQKPRLTFTFGGASYSIAGRGRLKPIANAINRAIEKAGRRRYPNQ